MYVCQNSRNILNMVEAFSLNGKTYIVTAFAEGGDLLNYLRALDVFRLSEVRAKAIVFQIAHGLKEMRACGIVHRDIKHENIFLSDLSDEPTVKIGDFGMACKLDEDECI